VREGYFDVSGVKCLLQAAVEFPADAPLLDRFGCGARFDDNSGICELV